MCSLFSRHITSRPDCQDLTRRMMADNVEVPPDATTPTLNISRRLLCKHLQKIHINNGDVLAVKATSQAAKIEILRGIADALGRIGKKDIVIVVVDNFTDLSVLNEKGMNKHGWFRIPQLAKLIHSKQDAEEEKKEEASNEENRA